MSTIQSHQRWPERLYILQISRNPKRLPWNALIAPKECTSGNHNLPLSNGWRSAIWLTKFHREVAGVIPVCIARIIDQNIHVPSGDLGWIKPDLSRLSLIYLILNQPSNRDTFATKGHDNRVIWCSREIWLVGERDNQLSNRSRVQERTTVICRINRAICPTLYRERAPILKNNTIDPMTLIGGAENVAATGVLFIRPEAPNIDGLSFSDDESVNESGAYPPVRRCVGNFAFVLQFWPLSMLPFHVCVGPANTRIGLQIAKWAAGV